MPTKLIPCSCKHPMQDRLHGYGVRVHNLAKKENVIKGWRCTVCVNLKPAGGEMATPKEKKRG